MHGFRLGLEQIAEIDLEDVDHADSGARSDYGGQGLEVGIVFVRGEQDEFLHSRCLPRVDEVVEHAVQRFAA